MLHAIILMNASSYRLNRQPNLQTTNVLFPQSAPPDAGRQLARGHPAAAGSAEGPCPGAGWCLSVGWQPPAAVCQEMWERHFVSVRG